MAFLASPTLLYWVLGPWTGFFLGILHTLMPCEDKAIFCFYAFGVSRDWRQAFRILFFYGLGLFLMNLVVGSILSYIAGNLGGFFLGFFDRTSISIISSISLILGGVIMLYQLYRNKYWPHSDQLQELGENLPMLKARKRTSFLLGLLAGIPPCIFELTVYVYAMYYSAISSWGNGVWTVFFFGIGTWIGLVPLALIGTMSGRISKLLRQSSLKRFTKKTEEQKIRNQNQLKRQSESAVNSDSASISSPNLSNLSNSNINSKIPAEIQVNQNDAVKQKTKKENAPNNSNYSKLELFSAGALILLGIILFILALNNINLFVFEEPPIVPEIPF